MAPRPWYGMNLDWRTATHCLVTAWSRTAWSSGVPVRGQRREGGGGQWREGGGQEGRGGEGGSALTPVKEEDVCCRLELRPLVVLHLAPAKATARPG